MDELDVGAEAAGSERHPQGVEDEVRPHVSGELPADDPAAPRVDDEGEETHPLPGAQVGEIGDPETVGARRGEVALDQIGAPPSARILSGGAPGLAAALGALDPARPHQPPDAVAADLLAGPQQRLPGAAIAVGGVVPGVDLGDPLEQALVGDRPL